MRHIVPQLLLSLLMLLTTTVLNAQQKNITGTVLDDLGPIAGASVVIKGTTNGTSTGSDGKFSLTATPDQTLVFSYLGYSTQEVVVETQNNLKIVLQQSSMLIDEFVVIGYGVQRKSDVTGSVVTVKPEDMLTFPSSNVGEMLRGRAAGVEVVSQSGRPGSSPKIKIRGERSMTKDGNDPLYIIDGSPASGAEFGTLNGTDIQSVEILKDAAAQAIYGARAANGVVLVTTKRGKSGKPVVNLDSYVGLQTLWRNFDYYSPEEWYNLRREAKSTDLGLDPSALTPDVVFEDDIMVDAYNNNTTQNWEKLMLRSALTHKHDLSVRGGTEKIRVAASLGYFDQEGMARYGSGYTRGSLRLNLDYDIAKWVSIGFNTSASRSKQEREDGKFNEYITRAPYSVIYDDEGNYSPYLNTSMDVNPLFRAQNYKREIKTDNYRINGFLDIKPLEGLSYRLNVSLFDSNAKDGSYRSSKYPGGGSSGSLDNRNVKNTLIENIINYTVPIRNNNHKLTLTAIQAYDKSMTTELNISANKIPVDRDWNMIGDGEITKKERNISEVLLLSYAARVQYSLMDKYILTAAWRRDGSSKFGKNNKWGDFPSVAVAWRISEESFIKNVRTISNLRLRLSYGIVGNQSGIGAYRSLGLASPSDMEFGDNLIVGYLPGIELPNPNLKWETTASANAALEFGLFKNRLTGSVEYYHTVTKDLLIERSINATLGYSKILDNLGETRTDGVDVNLKGEIFRSEKFSWDMTVNFSHAKDRIVKINGERDLVTNQYLDDIANSWFIGQPINVYHSYLFDGIYQYDDFVEHNGKYYLRPTIDTDGDGIGDKILERSDNVVPGMIKLKDANGDGKITDADRVPINKNPDFTMSFSTGAAFKGFDLFADFYWVHGGKMLNSYLYEYTDGGALTGKLNGVKVNYWTPTNPSNDFPRPSMNTTPVNLKTAAYQDASYFRFRSLSLGYTLPKELTKRILIERCRFYVTATNLFTITDIKSFSPDLGPGAYPEARQWIFGLNLTF